MSFIFPLIAVFFCLCCPFSQASGKVKPSPVADDYEEYTDFFEKVYKQFEDHYFLAPNRKIYNDFLEKFQNTIYAQLKNEKKSDDYVRWRAAWYLVDALKAKEDRFSQFYPPAPAQEFQKEALGQLVDLGIEGKKVDNGFVVTRIEPRSDAYDKGIREEDVLLTLDKKFLKGMSQEDIDKALTPLIDTKVQLTYIAHESGKEQAVSLVSKEYFKQTVFLRPVPVDGVFCLEIPKFNRTTGDDMFRFLTLIEAQHPRGLVLDLRGNPGGPPLAAREISAFFLKGGEDFAYFQKRGIPKDNLDVPIIPQQYTFKAPIIILVDQDSGSASELFSGIMQFRGRALVWGTNTAGQVLLKTMFPMDDGSMVALVTAPGYYPDGSRFSFDGITPDQIINGAPKEGLINLAAAYIVMKQRQK